MSPYGRAKAIWRFRKADVRSDSAAMSVCHCGRPWSTATSSLWTDLMSERPTTCGGDIRVHS